MFEEHLKEQGKGVIIQNGRGSLILRRKNKLSLLRTIKKICFLSRRSSEISIKVRISAYRDGKID